ncbi:MAG: YegP family protein [Blastocatellia bacterium]
MSAKFEIKKAADSSFYFHLKAANGEIILASQMYTSPAKMEEGLESVKKNAQNAAIVDLASAG